ncbi:MAG: membrane protein insertion efficiency factor YidD [Holophagaceae bacterium]|nr:membrane protein insertion efficiency factor YidD [Holophagaceae bacterium]
MASEDSHQLPTISYQKDKNEPDVSQIIPGERKWKGYKMALMAWIWVHPWYSVCGYLLLESLMPVPLQPTAWVLRGAIRTYQLTLSPALPSICKFQPSCSHYGLEAIQKYGTLKGGMLTSWRILRCNPFNKGGDDPLH